MSDKLLRNRKLCLEQAETFLVAAGRVGEELPHIVYHLSLLALEEVGKASMIGGELAVGGKIESQILNKGMENHRRKLQWAVWSPLTRIDPADFEAARLFAERAHAIRLASLYVDARADLADTPPRDVVSIVDSNRALALARARLDYEIARGEPDLEAQASDELMTWFLDAMGDLELSRFMLSKPVIDKFHALDCDARAWVAWARDELAKRDSEDKALLEAELARPRAEGGDIKPKWRARAVVYTPSHAIRPKVLNRWNEQIEAVQLIWTNNKDRFTLQLTMYDNVTLAELDARGVHLAKLSVSCLNIGSIGYFWFEPPGFERAMFSEIRDLERDRLLDLKHPEGFWGDQRAVALKDEHVENALRCMMAYAGLPEEDAEPIFRPYYDGLAMIAKSDRFYSLDLLARAAFVTCLANSLKRYGGWDGKPESLRLAFDAAFSPIMPTPEHRDRIFTVFNRDGDPADSALGNLRTAKHAADLYLNLVATTQWRGILEKGEKQQVFDADRGRGSGS